MLTIIALIVVPLVWSLPQALMSAELSLMIDENGGNVVWVQRAFGNFVGWMNAYNNLINSIMSLALLCQLFVTYLSYPFTSTNFLIDLIINHS
jgi:amino acid transporter